MLATRPSGSNGHTNHTNACMRHSACHPSTVPHRTAPYRGTHRGCHAANARATHTMLPLPMLGPHTPHQCVVPGQHLHVLQGERGTRVSAAADPTRFAARRASNTHCSTQGIQHTLQEEEVLCSGDMSPLKLLGKWTPTPNSVMGPRFSHQLTAN